MKIEFASEDVPDSGKTLAIIDGLQWLRMPLPFELKHINLWILRDGDGWTLIDTGFGDQTTLDLWSHVFAEAMQGLPAKRVIATHMHPDHIGCAGHLTRHFDVDLWITRDEYLYCRVLAADTGKPAPEVALQFYRAAGFDDQQIESYRRAFGLFGRFVTPLPEAYRRLQDGDNLAIGDSSWRVIVGAGHSPEHASLYDAERKLLIAGDQLLPTISSIVAVWPTEPDANPLADWFAALQKLKQQVPEDVTVLPAHGKPFRGAHQRIDALVDEHERRLNKLLDCCREPQRVADTLSSLFKTRIDDGNRVMATGEALAHIHYLLATNDLTCDIDDGIAWYRAANA